MVDGAVYLVVLPQLTMPSPMELMPVPLIPGIITMPAILMPSPIRLILAISLLVKVAGLADGRNFGIHSLPVLRLSASGLNCAKPIAHLVFIIILLSIPGVWEPFIPMETVGVAVIIPLLYGTLPMWQGSFV